MLDMSFASVIAEARTRAGLTQRELAKRAGTSQPAIARLESGQASPTLATIARVAAAAGFEVRVELVPAGVRDPVTDAYKRDVDRTLLRENLRKTVTQRLRTLVELQEFGTELQRAVRRRSSKKRKA